MDASMLYACPESEERDLDESEMRSSKELDFVSHWLDKSIPSEIYRGASLRHTKSGSKRDVCDVAELSVDKEAPYFDCRYFTTKITYSSPRRHGMRSPLSSKACSPARTVVTNRKASSRPCTPKRGPKRCPLRIAQLAQPSKRQCLETWRTKCHMLPNIMLDRLKQIVMDQKTIAHIPDAIECFRVAKRNKRRAKKASNIYESRNLSAHHMEHVRNYCAVFGHRIANKLMAPRSVSLNSDLEKLSQVVHYEIGCMIKCDGLLYKKNVIQNERIHQEMSDKITVWIATILQDSSEKLLEEELRVEKLMEKKRLHQEDCYETLIGAQTQTINDVDFKYSHLEEEEGPVLDLLDELVYNVVGLCYKDSTANGMSESDVLKEYFDDAASADHLSVSSYGTGHSKDAQMVDLNENDEIEAIGGSMTDADEKEQEVPDQAETVDLDHTGSATVGEGSAPILDEEPLNSISSKDGGEVNNKLFVDNIVEQKTKEETIKTILNALIDQTNVSEVYVVIDEDPQDQSKTVKFTELDMVLARKSIDLSYMSESSDDMSASNMFRQQLKRPYEFPKPNVTLGPPNEHLLSDADESWPVDDIITPMLRMSQSVCKSITSMGNIMEDEDEVVLYENTSQDFSGVEETINVLQPDQPEYTDNLRYEDMSLQYDQTFGKTVNKQAADLLVEIKIQASDMKSKVKLTTEKTDDVHQNTSSDKNKDYASIMNSSPYTQGSPNRSPTDHDYEPTENESVSKYECFKDIGKGDHREIDEKNDIFVAVQQKFKAPAKVSYKVNPKSAPSWVNGSQSSEDSLISQLNVKNKHMSCIARKWAGELDRAFATLERWNLWMDSTCRKVIFLKQREVTNNIFSPKNCFEDHNDWIKFKKSIDKDAALWKKLNSQLAEKFNLVKSKFTLMQEWKEKSNIIYKSSMIHTTDKFERWTHRMVDSGEYKMKCNCRNHRNENNRETKARRPCQPNTSRK